MGDATLATAGSSKSCCSFNRVPNHFKTAERPSSGLPGYMLLASVWTLQIYLACFCVLSHELDAVLDSFPFKSSLFPFLFAPYRRTSFPKGKVPDAVSGPAKKLPSPEICCSSSEYIPIYRASGFS